MTVVFIAALASAASFALIPAWIAAGKGESFGVWWLYGLLLWPVAMFHAIFVEEIDASNAQLRAEGWLR